MAPVETTDAATVDQRCSFKHRTGGDTIIQTQNCVSPCAWVKLIFSVSRIKLVIFAQGPCSLRQATRFARASLNRGHTLFSRQLDLCVSSLSREPCVLRKTTRFVRDILVQAISLYHSKKKKPDYPSQIIRVILMQGSCSSIQSHAIFVQGPCNSVQKKKLRHPCAGAMRPFSAEDKASGLCRERGHLFSLSGSTPARNLHLRTSSRGFHHFAPREHHGRPFWRETWR